MSQVLSRVQQLIYHFVLLITIFSAFCFVLLLVFGWGSHTVIYGLDMAQTSLWKFIPLLFIACTVYFFLALILFRKPTDVLNKSTRMVTLSLISAAFLWGTYFIAVWQTGPLGYREHIATAYLGSYTYNLQFYNADFAEIYSQRYDLYECQFNLLCEKIFTVSKSTGGIALDVEEIELVTDEVTKVIYVQVNGSTAFTHQP